MGIDYERCIERMELALHEIAGHGNISGEQARKIANDALKDLEVERVLAMTDEEVMATASADEIKQAMEAREDIMRRLGL